MDGIKFHPKNIPGIKENRAQKIFFLSFFFAYEHNSGSVCLMEIKYSNFNLPKSYFTIYFLSGNFVVWMKRLPEE